MEALDQEEKKLNKINFLREKIVTLRSKFGERRDYLSKVRLGWFNTISDNADLEAVK
jgi:hypothetical protein